MEKNKDYFHQASKHFLKEPLTWEQFNELANKGEYIPICGLYEGIDIDTIEHCINEVSELIYQSVYENR